MNLRKDLKTSRAGEVEAEQDVSSQPVLSAKESAALTWQQRPRIIKYDKDERQSRMAELLKDAYENSKIAERPLIDVGFAFSNSIY